MCACAKRRAIAEPILPDPMTAYFMTISPSVRGPLILCQSLWNRADGSLTGFIAIATEPFYSDDMARPRGFDRATALHRAMTAFWEHGGFDRTSISRLTAAMG